MSGTLLELNAELGETVHVCRSLDEAVALDPPSLFRRSEMLVLDDTPWRADLDLIRTGLEPIKRWRKGPWHVDPIKPEVAAQVDLLWAQVEEIFSTLYPDYTVVERERDFRTLITGPDPMHFDTHVSAHPTVTSFTNVAATPRQYRVGPTFRQLCDRQAELMARLWDEAKQKGHQDVSYVVRKRTQNGQPPLGGNIPSHRVDMAPGSIWFMDAKTLAHTAIYGEGTVLADWEVDGSDALQQPQIFKKMVKARKRAA